MSFGHFHIDEGTDPQTGVRTQYFFEGDQVVTQKTWDAEPYLLHAKALRAAIEAEGWGEGKAVGVIPPWETDLLQMPAGPDRDKATKQFFRDNRQFLAYDRFIL